MAQATAPTITAVIITKNEASMIANCIESLRWCNEILVIDNESEDLTAELARDLGARVITAKESSFAALRTRALKHTKTDWIFYVDADERVTPSLSQEILVRIETTADTSFKMKRQNVMFGQPISYTGWQQDWVERIFKREALIEWFGEIHESPRTKGSSSRLKTALIHLTHRSTVDGLRKSAVWTGIEARLLWEAKTPPVTALTLLRKTSMEFWRRLIIHQGYRDGMVGWIESFIQAFNRLLVYVQLWELQQQPPLSEQYERLEQQLAEQWRHSQPK
jgi:glycosyltransferase involved in cell wall biosynthesis